METQINPNESEPQLEGGSVDAKNLKKELLPYQKLKIIKSSDVPEAEKLSLVKQYGLNSKEPWVAPKTANAREFALDMMLLQLTEASSLKVGTMIPLPEKSI